MVTQILKSYRFHRQYSEDFSLATDATDRLNLAESHTSSCIPAEWRPTELLEYTHEPRNIIVPDAKSVLYTFYNTEIAFTLFTMLCVQN